MSRPFLLSLGLLVSLSGCVHDWDQGWPEPDAGMDQAVDQPPLPDSTPPDSVPWPRPRWIQVPAGEFSMGSPADEPCHVDIETEHQVQLTRTFALMTTEVTREDFERQLGYLPVGMDNSCEDPECPVGFVSWHEAAAFCNSLSEAAGIASCYSCEGEGGSTRCTTVDEYRGRGIYNCPGIRLPTEAEWEYSYRAGTSGPFYSGSLTEDRCEGASASADAIAWYEANSDGRSHIVGQLEPNAWGFYDLAGNLAEWCHDAYEKDLGSDQVLDPLNSFTQNNEWRVVRGGQFRSQPRDLRAAARGSNTPGAPLDTIGVRCARSWPVFRQLVVNQLRIPTQEKPYKFDYGDGPVNLLGTILYVLEAFGLNMEHEFELAMQDDERELLFEIYTPADGSANNMMLQSHLGLDVDDNWQDNASGSEAFAIDHESAAGLLMPAQVKGGYLDAGPGPVDIPLPLVGEGERVHLDQMRVSGVFTDTGLNGMISGVLPESSMNLIIRRVAIQFTLTLQSDKVPEEDKKEIRNLDIDGDNAISVEELRHNTVVTSILHPDVDLDGDGVKEGFSIGLGIVTNNCFIDRSLPNSLD